jgi:hypothetical protein
VRQGCSVRVPDSDSKAAATDAQSACTSTGAPNSATVQGAIKGYETVDYLLGARKGQSMNVSMATDNGANDRLEMNID